MPNKKEVAEIRKEAQGLSIEELEGRIQALDVEVQALRDHKAVLHEELDRKNELESAIRKAANMTDSEMAALVQHMKAEGIPTQEQAGEPGGE